MIQVKSEKSKYRRWIVTSILMFLILIALINIIFANKQNENPHNELKFVTVTKREFTDTLLLSGIAVPKNISSFHIDESLGNLDQLFVKEGDVVKEGEKLYSYTNSQLDLQQKQLELEQRMNYLEYNELEKKVSKLKDDILEAKEQKLGASVIDPLKNQLNEIELQKQLLSIKNQRVRLQLEDITNRKEDLIIYSDSNGTVETINKDAFKTSLSIQSEAIMKIVSNGPFLIKGFLTEFQRSEIKVGQVVIVKPKALPNITWKGKVIDIGKFPVEGSNSTEFPIDGSSSVSNYRYTISLKNQQEILQGLHTSIEVKLNSTQGLSIPEKSIIEESDNSYVFIKEGQIITKKQISTGNIYGNYIQVLDGLKEGDKIVESPKGSELEDGMEVKSDD